LRTAASLCTQMMSVAELASALGANVDAIGHALQALGQAGLLRTERVDAERRYRLDLTGLQALVETGADDGASGTPAPPPGIRTFFRGHRLERYPAQRSRQIAVLAWLVEDFEVGETYPEPEINRIIGLRHPDFATIRRALIDEGFMVRAGGIYQRIPGDSGDQGPVRED
jgi:hypothetical protein